MSTGNIMYAISKSANTGRAHNKNTILSSFNLMFTIFCCCCCHHQFHFVRIRMHHYSFTDLQFHWLSEWTNKRTSCGWRLFIHLFFRSTIFLHKYHSHSVCTLLWFHSVTNVLTAHPNTFYTVFLSLLWFGLYGFFFHSYDSLLNECIFQTQKLLCSIAHPIWKLCLYVCVVCVHPKCYQLQPHFMNGFLSFVVFFSRPKIFMFPQFYMFTRIVFSNFCSRKWNYFIRCVLSMCWKKRHTTIKPTELITEFFLFTLFFSASFSFYASVCWQLTVDVVFIFFGVSVWRQQIVCWQPIGFKLHN